MQFHIRKYQDSDLPALAKIYRGSIRHLGAECYTKEQVEAWSGFSEDIQAFDNWLKGATTLVAVDSENACVGFGGLEAHGRISSLFVSPEWMRKGVGSGVLGHLLEEAGSRAFSVVTTEASEFSRPLFEQHGFVVTEIEQTEFKGVKFTRYAMQARLKHGFKSM